MNEKLKERIVNSIKKVIYDPAHAIESDSSKNTMYNDKKCEELANKVLNIIKNYHLDKNIPEDVKIMIINDYIKNNVKIRKTYFDAFEERIPEIPKDELVYRTAYGALIKGEAMCAGYTESCRILCESVGIKTNTLLSKLPGKNKHLLHYVTLATPSNGKCVILDPEREASCEKKGYDFHKYQESMDFLTPTNSFFDDKVGKNGVGKDVYDFINDSIKRKEGSSLFLINKDNKVYLKTSNPEDESSTKDSLCNPLDKLVKDPKFIDFITKHRAVFMVQGLDNIKALSNIMNIAEKQYNNQKDTTQCGE